MTLVEILIALAIASLMTLTGWRALDALQTSRDRVTADAAQWQQLDDFFATLESDLRRASLTAFRGSATSFTLLQPPIDGGIRDNTVTYSFRQGNGQIEIIREAGSDRTLLGTVQSVAVTYSEDGGRFNADIASYPRALRLSALPLGQSAAVERLLALR